MEKFADLVERTVVTLKENKQNSDLEGGTLYAIVLRENSLIAAQPVLQMDKGKGKNWNPSRNYNNGSPKKPNTRFRHQR